MKTVLSTLILLISTSLYSQNLIQLNEKNHAVRLSYGIDPTYILALQYRYTHEFTSQFKVAGFIDVNSPTHLFGKENYESKLGIYIPYLFINNCGILYEGNVSTGHVETKNFSSQKIAFSNRLYFGIYKPKWHFQFGLAHEHIYANKITHTDYYRNYIYPEAIDGWYRGAGGNFQSGIEYGYVFHQKFETAIEFKLPKSEKWNSYYGAPAHIMLHFAYRM
jgi:hypothetical protein